MVRTEKLQYQQKKKKLKIKIYMCCIEKNHYKLLFLAHLVQEASSGAAAQSVTVKSTSYGFDPHSKKLNIYLNVNIYLTSSLPRHFHFFALVSKQRSATQHAKHELGKWGKECLNTRYRAMCGIQREADLIYFF